MSTYQEDKVEGLKHIVKDLKNKKRAVELYPSLYDLANRISLNSYMSGKATAIGEFEEFEVREQLNELLLKEFERRVNEK